MYRACPCPWTWNGLACYGSLWPLMHTEQLITVNQKYPPSRSPLVKVWPDAWCRMWINTKRTAPWQHHMASPVETGPEEQLMYSGFTDRHRGQSFLSLLHPRVPIPLVPVLASHRFTTAAVFYSVLAHSYQCKYFVLWLHPQIPL